MNYLDCLIIGAESDYDYNNTSLVSKKILDLTEDEKTELVNYLISYIHTNKQFIKTLESYGFYKLDAIKEQKGIKFTNKDKLYFSNYSLNELNEYI